MATGSANWCLFFTLLMLVLLPGYTTPSIISGADLGVSIKRAAEDGLGSKAIQTEYDTNVNFKIHIRDGNRTIKSISDNLALYIETLYAVVRRNHDAILTSLTMPENSNGSGRLPMILCCDVDEKTLTDVPLLRVKADPNSLCVRFSSDVSNNPKTMRDNLVTSMRRNSQQSPNIGWQYYGNEKGVHFTYMSRKNCVGKERSVCCFKYDPRKRPWYNKARVPTPIDLVIVIDMTSGGNVTLKINAAKTIITALSASTRLAVVKFCHDTHVTSGGVKGDACYSSRLALATGPNVAHMSKFVSTVPRACRSTANYQPAIRRAFEYFKLSPPRGINRKKLLVLLTDSDPNDAESLDAILKTARDENEHPEMNNEVLIQTYGFGNMSASTQSLLQTMADATKYTNSKGEEHHGGYTNIRNGENLRYQMGSFFNLFTDTHNSSKAIITAPYVDFSGLGLVVSICQSVVHKGSLQGVTCVDARVQDIFLNVTYYQHSLDAYLFIIDSEGRTISHPLLPNPTEVNHNPVFVSISDLERAEAAQEVISSMRSGRSGSKTFYVSRRFNLGGSYESSATREVASHYYWQKVASTDFSICVVFTDNDGDMEMTLKNWRGETNYQHPLTIRGITCTNAGEYTVTKEMSTVRFNGTAFKFIDLSLSEAASAIQYRNYLTGYLTRDQGRQFKEIIRDEVRISGLVDNIWKARTSSVYSAFLRWRYLVTTSDVIRVFPGTYYHSFSPSIQAWYHNAISHHGHVLLTRMNNGEKHAIMMSTAILKGNPKGRHSSLDPPVAVVAGEFVQEFYTKMLMSVFKPCQEENAVCFLVDNKGYVLVHTEFDNKGGPHCHLITMEKAIAEHLRENKNMVEEKCLDWENYRTIQSWTLSPEDWVVKSSSPRYELHQVAGTNVFIGITWKTLERAHPICGCTNVTECSNTECPCYKSLRLNYCENQFVSEGKSDDSPTCPIVKEMFSPFASFPEDSSVRAPTGTCFWHACSDATKESDCLPTSVCAWCPTEEGPSICQDIMACVAHGAPGIPLVEQPSFLVGLLIAISVISIVLLLLMALYICYTRYRLTKALNALPPPIPPRGNQAQQEQRDRATYIEDVYLGLNELMEGEVEQEPEGVRQEERKVNISLHQVKMREKRQNADVSAQVSPSVILHDSPSQEASPIPSGEKDPLSIISTSRGRRPTNERLPAVPPPTQRDLRQKQAAPSIPHAPGSPSNQAVRSTSGRPRDYCSPMNPAATDYQPQSRDQSSGRSGRRPPTIPGQDSNQHYDPLYKNAPRRMSPDNSDSFKCPEISPKIAAKESPTALKKPVTSTTVDRSDSAYATASIQPRYVVVERF